MRVDRKHDTTLTSLQLPQKETLENDMNKKLKKLAKESISKYTAFGRDNTQYFKCLYIHISIYIYILVIT